MCIATSPREWGPWQARTLPPPTPLISYQRSQPNPSTGNIRRCGFRRETRESVTYTLQTGTGRPADGQPGRIPTISQLSQAFGRPHRVRSAFLRHWRLFVRTPEYTVSNLGGVLRHQQPPLNFTTPKAADPPAKRRPFTAPYSAATSGGEWWSRDRTRKVLSRAMQASLLTPALAWGPKPVLGGSSSVRRAPQWGHTRAQGAHAPPLTHSLSHTHSHSTLGVHDNRAARSHGLNRGGSQDSALEGRRPPSVGAFPCTPHHTTRLREPVSVCGVLQHSLGRTGCET